VTPALVTPLPAPYFLYSKQCARSCDEDCRPVVVSLVAYFLAHPVCKEASVSVYNFVIKLLDRREINSLRERHAGIYQLPYSHTDLVDV